jgi:hypothetical protein
VRYLARLRLRCTGRQASKEVATSPVNQSFVSVLHWNASGPSSQTTGKLQHSAKTTQYS